jgi:hypothetical protein
MVTYALPLKEKGSCIKPYSGALALTRKERRIT